MRRLVGLGVAVALGASLFAYRSTRSSGASIGSTQPLAIGTSVAVEPNLQTPAAALSVAAGVQIRGRITLRTRKPSGIGWKTNGGRVELFVTATLDATTSVPVGGQASLPVVFPVETSNTRELPFDMPPLDAGHHCLVVAALESPSTMYGHRATIDHYSAVAVDIDAGAGPDHCAAPRNSAGEIADHLPIACDLPLITPDPRRAVNGGRFKAGTRLWAMAPGCPGARAVSVLLHHNERAVLGDVRYASIRVPSDGRNRVIDLGALPRGTWRIIVVASGERSAAFAGPAVLVK